jgi:hypothetical protein
MRSKRHLSYLLHVTIVTFPAVALLVLLPGLGLAQSDGGTPVQEQTQVRSQAQIGDASGDLLRERTREQIRERIDHEPGLQDAERARLREHLRACDELGLDDAAVAAMFDTSRPLREQMRSQERVLALARDELPVEPLVEKLQEGRRKGAREEALEQVCARMEENVRTAHRVLEQARQAGVDPGGPDVERQLTRGLAMDMWRGLHEGDLQQLHDRAQQRLRDHSCTTVDLAAAAETATQLREAGVDRQRAVGLAGEALQRGYTAREVREISWMVMTAHMHGEPPEDLVDRLERGLHRHEQMQDMMQSMWSYGWMGPADEHGGHGGHSPVDDVMGGGPGGHGGDDQGHGGHGGMGGGHGGMGGGD